MAHCRHNCGLAGFVAEVRVAFIAFSRDYEDRLAADFVLSSSRLLSIIENSSTVLALSPFSLDDSEISVCLVMLSKLHYSLLLFFFAPNPKAAAAWAT